MCQSVTRSTRPAVEDEQPQRGLEAVPAKGTAGSARLQRSQRERTLEVGARTGNAPQLAVAVSPAASCPRRTAAALSGRWSALIAAQPLLRQRRHRRPRPLTVTVATKASLPVVAGGAAWRWALPYPAPLASQLASRSRVYQRAPVPRSGLKDAIWSGPQRNLKKQTIGRAPESNLSFRRSPAARDRRRVAAERER